MTTPDELYTLTPEDAHKLATFGPFLDEPQINGAGLQEPEPLTPDPDRFTLPVQTAAELCQEPDTDAGQLLGPLVLAGGRTIIVGDTGEGKTTLAFQLVRTILEGDHFLGYPGKGGGRALIIDLEQGRRSVKRALRDANLHHRNDVDLVLVPDGLSLDRDPDHLAELDRVIHQGGYTLVDLDPYYKAHRADEPNAERPIVDLMRTLDSLRARYGFALLLPAHPRKEPPGAASVRKLTIHDIAGSGAVTRGAEIVLGIERVAHGLARLRYLKDREGDLPIGEAWNLLYNKTDGFKRDPKDEAPERNYRTEILNLTTDGEWRTMRDLMDTLKAGDKTLRPTLNQLERDGLLEYQEGPEGRHKNSKCWRHTTASDPRMHLNADDADTTYERETLTTASGVSPLRGTPVDAEEFPPTASKTEDPDADTPIDLAWLEARVPDQDDLNLEAGTLDE